MLKKGDIYLVAAVLLIALAGFAALKINSGGEGHKIAVIKQDGKVIRKVDLDSVKKSEEMILKGNYTNTILLEKGRIRFEDADCPNKDCVRAGWLSAKGAVAVCLPNKVTIKIEGANLQIDGGTY